jgi:hypothetical protein
MGPQPRPRAATRREIARLCPSSTDETSLAQLVDWAEAALLDGEFAEQDADALRFVISRVGIADVRAFGLTWEDCEALLDRLGYRTRIEVFA